MKGINHIRNMVSDLTKTLNSSRAIVEELQQDIKEQMVDLPPDKKEQAQDLFKRLNQASKKQNPTEVLKIIQELNGIISNK